MKEKMKVHAFGVKIINKSGNLEDLLQQIHSDPLSKRVRNIAFNDIRIENVKNDNNL